MAAPVPITPVVVDPVTEAFKRVGARPEGQVIRTYLENQLNTLNEQLAIQPDATQLRISQGKAQVIRVLVKLLQP